MSCPPAWRVARARLARITSRVFTRAERSHSGGSRKVISHLPLLHGLQVLEGEGRGFTKNGEPWDREVVRKLTLVGNGSMGSTDVTQCRTCEGVTDGVLITRLWVMPPPFLRVPAVVRIPLAHRADLAGDEVGLLSEEVQSTVGSSQDLLGDSRDSRQKRIGNPLGDRQLADRFPVFFHTLSCCFQEPVNHHHVAGPGDAARRDLW